VSKPRTKPRKTKLTSPIAPLDGVAAPAPEVLTLSEAAAYLRVPEAEVERLVKQQDIPGRLIGTEWRLLKTALQDWQKTPPIRGSREAVLSTIGSWKDDPNWEKDLEEIYKRRGRPITHDGE
jgi:excisionase family DNA binding protein